MVPGGADSDGSVCTCLPRWVSRIFIPSQASNELVFGNRAEGGSLLFLGRFCRDAQRPAPNQQRDGTVWYGVSQHEPVRVFSCLGA